jgi:hypothetical protein
MNPKRIFDILTQAVGLVMAQAICSTLMLVFLALGYRTYAFLDDNLAGGLDPLKFVLGSAVVLIVFSAWRILSSADLDG